ncbi:MAG: hypothetical protein SRB2_04476 [Desulfobacteraceae bacterium Eth-SRB2]|nr:MAG: hypothetical protein SRB2_04476 [Desulfobacteraceae bacterium Eth-SRB2]
MLREQQKFIKNAHKALDICLTVGAFVSAYFIKRLFLPASLRGLLIAPNYYIVLLIIIIIWYLTFRSFNVYASYRKRTFPEIFWNMFKAVVIGMALLFVAMYIFKITDVSRILLGIFFLLNVGLLAASKASVYGLLSHYRKKGYNFRNLLIVGSMERAKTVIDRVGTYLNAGFRILGCLETDPDKVGTDVQNGINVIGTVENLERILREEVVDEVIFAIPLRKIAEADRHIFMAEQMGVSVRIVPEWPISFLTNQPGEVTINFEDFLGIPTMAVRTTPPVNASLLFKNFFDIIAAGIVFLLFLPFMFLIGCAIKIISPGPIFYKQERCCVNGRRFMLYKFRTMVPDAEKQQDGFMALNEADGPAFKIKKDARITPYIGTFLRKTSLDELPQLINVLRGEMSLVGPRPPIPSEVERYDIWQRRRLSMKPGLTCIWQCAPNRNDICFNEWMKMDLHYIDNWSLWLDIKILFRTVKAVVLGNGR